MRFRRKRSSLVERLRPYVDPGPPPEQMVSADPIRMFLYRWMIETGDPIEVVAKGFDVEPGQLLDVVSGRRLCVSIEEDAYLRRRLGL